MPRKTGPHKRNKTLLIVVEGETEQIYFSEMKSIERISGVYDFVWCVFDNDAVIQDGISKKIRPLIERAKRSNIKFADYFPLFEVWYLLHYIMPKIYYNNQNELINELKKYISNYEKSKNWLCRANLYSRLKPEHTIAICNSSSLASQNTEEKDSIAKNSNVYKLFAMIEELKKENIQSNEVLLSRVNFIW